MKVNNESVGKQDEKMSVEKLSVGAADENITSHVILHNNVKVSSSETLILIEKLKLVPLL
ncbi:MAG: hypothetical protein ACRC2A_17230 [Enterobacterales bacterium]